MLSISNHIGMKSSQTNTTKDKSQIVTTKETKTEHSKEKSQANIKGEEAQTKTKRKTSTRNKSKYQRLETTLAKSCFQEKKYSYAIHYYSICIKNLEIYDKVNVDDNTVCAGNTMNNWIINESKNSNLNDHLSIMFLLYQLYCHSCMCHFVVHFLMIIYLLYMIQIVVLIF